MAKHSKKKTRHKRQQKKKKHNNDFYLREKELNKLISKFVKDYYSLAYPPLEEEYDDMNKQRLEIKRLFYLQDSELWHQSKRRKRFYHEQLNKFKYYYSAWKHLTYYIYLNRKYDMPYHLCNALSFYKKHTHNIQSAIYLF